MVLPRMKRFLKIFAVLAGIVTAGPAVAHPHVWVTMKTELVYAPDGAITAVRHAWTFDDMFSAFATQGIDTKQKGVFTREELAPLAEVNITSMKDYDFFSFAKASGTKAQFVDPKDYYLEHKDQMLTLHFVLPFKTPVKAQDLELEIYDSAYFVDFSFAEKDPVKLVNAPPRCQLNVARPNDANAVASQAQRLDRSFAQSTEAFSGMGAQFANRIAVKCS
jgi:ABC-type uncharacterized transport system substrate-binding protein